jgi:Amt family ammonium transporter
VTTFLVHCGALLFVAAFSFCGSWLLYRVTDMIIPLRVSEDQEEMGLDLSQHGEVMEESAAPAVPVLARIA